MIDRDTPPIAPTVGPTKERLWQFVADALDQIQRGAAVVVEDLLADCPEWIGRGRELVRDLAAFQPVDWAPTPTDVPLPQPFPKDFFVTRFLGEGTYGRVWLAEDLHLPRQVAIKTIRVAAGSDGAVEALAALRREAGFLVGISHPNVVRVYGWRQSGDDHYLLLEYVPGGSLDELVRGGPLPWERAGRYVADVAAGLLEAHGKGIVHRDIKPANILLDTKSDDAKLTDFGVAGRLADAGTVIGTATYMAPEAFLGRATQASDVYCLAVTLFRLIAGEVPFRGATRDEQVRLIEQGLPNPDPRLVGVPESLVHVVRAGLAANADHRPPLQEFMARLRSVLNQSPVDVPAGVERLPVGLPLGERREDTPDRWGTSVTVTPSAGGQPCREISVVPREPKQAELPIRSFIHPAYRVCRLGGDGWHEIVQATLPPQCISVSWPMDPRPDVDVEIPAFILSLPKFGSVQDLLDEIYRGFLWESFPPETYGSQWVLASDHPEERLVVPLDWVSATERGGYHLDKRWAQGSSPQAVGILPGTDWYIRKASTCPDPLALAVNDALLIEIATGPKGMKALRFLVQSGILQPGDLAARADVGLPHVAVLNGGTRLLTWATVPKGTNFLREGHVRLTDEDRIRWLNYSIPRPPL